MNDDPDRARSPRGRTLLTTSFVLALLASTAELRAQPAEQPPDQGEQPAPGPPAEPPPAAEPPAEPPPGAEEPAEPEPEPAPAKETPARQPPSAEESVSPEELAEIQKALGSDAKAAEEARGTETTGDDGGAQGKSTIATTAAALLPDISIILDVALAYFSQEENLQSGDHDPHETGFNLQQLELSLAKSVDPYFRFDSNIVFSLDGVEIEEAYATTLSLPWNLQVRAGQMLTRFGRMNPTHPHSWNFVDQPFYLGKVFGGEGNRGLGVELSVLLPLPWYVELIGSTTRADGEGTARSFYGDDNQGIHSPLDFQNTGIIEQFFDMSDDVSLLWGLSVANGPNPYGRDTRSDVYGTDLYLKYRPITRQSFTIVSLQAEWLYRRRQIPLGVLHDHGGYAELFWRFAQRWGTAARYDYGSPTWDAASGALAIDPLDPAQVDDRHRVSANLTFWPTEFSRLRLQGSVDLPGWLPDPIWAAALAFEVSAGTHGAHPF